MLWPRSCDKVFVDVGANRGDSLVKWFTEKNCYEECYERRYRSREDCFPANVTCASDLSSGSGCTQPVNATCFCGQLGRTHECGWEWPFWLPLRVRQGYCAVAFEPNPHLALKLRRQATWLERKGFAPFIQVRNGTALSSVDGTAQFGLDINFTLGSSLVLHKRTMGADGKVNKGPEVGTNQVTVRTVDAVSYLRALPMSEIALKIDIEGSEFTVLRDLLASGTLCQRVEHLWIEWHMGRIDWRKVGLPVSEGKLMETYSWMLKSMQGHWTDDDVQMMRPLSPHCRTRLGKWA
jgi:FkbM family methyltransferase